MLERNISVDVSELRRDFAGFRLKNKRRVRALCGAIGLTGAVPPVTVAKIGDKLVLVDGFKRIEAARTAKIARVPATILEINRCEALVLLAQLNREAKNLTALEEGWIIAELHSRHGKTFKQIGALFGRDKTWTLRREQLVLKLSPEAQNLIRDGGLDPAAAEEIIKLPHGNQEILARRAAQVRLSVAQIRILVKLILESPDERTSAYILANPREAIALVEQQNPWSELELLLELAPRWPNCPRVEKICELLKDLLEVLKDGTGNGRTNPRTPSTGHADSRNRAPAEIGA